MSGKRSNVQNRYRVEGDRAYIALTQGQETVVDLDDLERVLAHRWCVIKTYREGSFYARSTDNLYLHRFILGLTEKGDYADHINGDGLDNRKSNLRSATNQQNAQNRTRPDPRSKTGARGVSTAKIGNNTYYVAKVSVTKYFPYTDDGYAQAVDEAIELRRKMKEAGAM